MKTIMYLGALSLTLGLLGCAGAQTKETCENNDWVAIGLKDGLKGETGEHYFEHKEACAKHNVTADIKEYEKGYVKGVIQYCTHDGGYAAGKRGDKYQAVCPTSVEAEFSVGYKKGWKEYIELETAKAEQDKISRKSTTGNFSGMSQTY